MRARKGGIAFFDSGIGGLTVVDACRKLLPDVLFYYYGDNKRAPYGNLPLKKIKKYAFQAFKKFKKMQVKAAVVACNTVTAVCIEELRASFPFPIIGTEPAVYPAMRMGGEVFVLSTRATYKSNRFQDLCERARAMFPYTILRTFPCDGLAGVIEKGVISGDFDCKQFLPEGTPSSVVLGCTHYAYVAEQIKAFYHCSVFDGNEGVAKRLVSVLTGEIDCVEHSQPLNDHLQPFMDKNTTKKGELGKKKNRIKISFAIFKMKRRTVKKDGKKEGKSRIIFLGSGRKYNKRVYEHLFL